MNEQEPDSITERPDPYRDLGGNIPDLTYEQKIFLVGKGFGNRDMVADVTRILDRRKTEETHGLTGFIERKPEQDEVIAEMRQKSEDMLVNGWREKGYTETVIAAMLRARREKQERNRR